MNKRISDDPGKLARECDAWSWVRAAGVSAEELRDALAEGPKDAPRRRDGDEPKPIRGGGGS